MLQATISLPRPTRKLLSHVPETDLSRLLAEVFALAASEPKLLEMIDRDRDAYALRKKKERIEDRVWLESQGRPLPGFDISADADWADELDLDVGRPRMPAILVLIFIAIRGYLGGFKDRKTLTMLLESKTLEIVLVNLNHPLPGASTILDNVNVVSATTQSAILDAQIGKAMREGLDDFTKVTADSTGVEANSIWPTDSGTIAGLAARSEHLLRELATFGITLRLPAIVRKLVADVSILHKQIQLTSGKKDSAIKRKRLYRKQFKHARKVRQALLQAYERSGLKSRNVDVMPSHRARLMTRLDWIEVDLRNLELAIDNASQRILRDKKVLIEDKILSLSDESAAMIVKGGREPILGYKPQIARSGNGFVVALIVPEGNAADSGQLRPIADQAIQRTGVLPSVLSFDDGYTNADDRAHYIGLKINVVSFSGAKGKRLIPDDEYESEPYRQARNGRSAVESLIFTLKHNTDFDRVMRRGIDAVRAELGEKAIAYNFFRMIRLRETRNRKKLAA